MQVLIFIVVLIALIVVHELGHFIAAKLSGMRVDEFGLGYPPRALTIGKIGDTEYTLNWLPFGGFVRIYGEDGIVAGDVPVQNSRGFTGRPRILQTMVLLAGILMNLVFAYVLITSGLLVGTPHVLDQKEMAVAKNVELAVVGILPDSPAAKAGLVQGDVITNAVFDHGAWKATDPESFMTFVNQSAGKAVIFSVVRNGTPVAVTVTPSQHIIPTDMNRYAVGVEVATIGLVPISFKEAVVQGAQITWGAIQLIAVGLWNFFAQVFTFHANFADVAGPVGIAGAVGTATTQGFGSLLSLVAIISINLALINLLPIPALDGGRLLFVIIESITRRPIPARVANTVNSISFALLALLMLVVTAHDIFKLFG